MDFDDIALFARVAKARSFSAAAGEMGLPKQTVSRRIRQLEETLGVELFHRTTRRVTVTETGERLLALADDSGRVLANMMALRDSAHGSPRGALRLSADPLFGECFLSPLLSEFLARHPAVCVETQLSTRRIDLLEDGFDAAFRIGPLEDSSARVRSLGPAHVRYVASPGYLEKCASPDTPSDLAHHECLVLHYEGTGSQRWLFRKNGRDEWQTVRGRYRSNSFRSLYDAARQGHGIVAAPAFYCEEDLAAGRIASVLDDWLPDFGNINLVYPEQRQLSSTLRAFVDFTVTWFTENPIP